MGAMSQLEHRLIVQENQSMQNEKVEATRIFRGVC